MRGIASTLLIFGVLLAASRAAADVALVMDPSPPISSKFVLGDFPETSPGSLEKYDFSGVARNDGSTTRRLLLRARANGTVIAGSERSYDCAPEASTNIVYHYTAARGATVGLEFEPADGTLTRISGVFQAVPAAAAPAPATPPGMLAWFAALLLVVGAWLSRGTGRERAKSAN